MRRSLRKRHCENIPKLRRSSEYLFLIFLTENLIGLNFTGMDWRPISRKIEVKAKIRMSLFSTPNRSTPKRGVGRSKEDVDRFVDRIQESEVVTESFRKGGMSKYCAWFCNEFVFYLFLMFLDYLNTNNRVDGQYWIFVHLFIIICYFWRNWKA